MLRTIKLYGAAGQTFGKEFRLDVSSLAEAVRALSVQFKGFKEFLEKHNFRVVWGSTLRKGINLGEDQVKLTLGTGDIHIVPVVQGNKKGGLFKIIAGVFLLAAAFFVPMTLGVGMGTAIGLGSMTYGNLAILGLGMIASGVVQMLTKTPKNKDPKKDDSFLLDGTLNVTEQGGPVPVIYGRMMVGSVLISAGISTVDIAVPGKDKDDK